MINKQHHIFISLILLITSLLFVWALPLSDIGYSVLMCTNFAWVIYVTWRVGKLSPYFFFLATTCFLFIGGRFWAILVAPDVFELRRGNFFNINDIPPEIWLNTLTYILLFLYISTIVYVKCLEDHIQKPILYYKNSKITRFDIFLVFLFALLMPLTLYDIVKRLMMALSSGGYLSLYLEQTENVAAGSGLIASLVYVFLGMALVYGNRKIKILYLILIFIKAFVFIVIGQRGKFGAMMLFFVWYYFRNRKVNIIKIALLGGLGIVLLMIIASLSVRAIVSDTNVSPFTLFGQFFYSQGVSITTFTNSQEIESYPIVPYFVTFLPGFASIWSLFQDLPGSQASFPNFLAYTLSPSIFESGHGLGWTLLSDLYLYSGRTFIGFALLSALFGYICAKLENKSRTSELASIIVFSIFLNLTFLPRAGLYTIIPLIIWTCLMYYIFIHLLGFNKEIQFEHNQKIEEGNDTEQDLSTDNNN